MAVASEQIRKRLENQSAILRCIREQGSISRSRISEICEVRKASVTHICRDLVDRGALDELEPGFYRSEVELSSRFWKALAIHVTPDEVVAAVVDHRGTLGQQWTRKTGNRNKPEAYLAVMESLIREALESGTEFVGMGISIPGIVDVDRGVCRSSINLGHWEGVPLVELLEKALPPGTPGILLENDAAAGLVANHWFQDFAFDLEESIYVSLGRGVGCAQMSGGKLARGQRYAAGEIGCLPSGAEGRRCPCGKEDCLQTYCGEAGLVKSLVNGESSLSRHTLAEICSAAADDPKLRAHFQQALSPLIDKIGTMIALSDPSVLVVACHDPRLAEIVPEVLRAGLQNYLGGGDTGMIPITRGFPPAEACLLGAGASVFEIAFSQESLRLS